MMSKFASIYVIGLCGAVGLACGTSSRAGDEGTAPTRAAHTPAPDETRAVTEQDDTSITSATHDYASDRASGTDDAERGVEATPIVANGSDEGDSPGGVAAMPMNQDEDGDEAAVPMDQDDPTAGDAEHRASATLTRLGDPGEKVGTVELVQRGDQVTIAGEFQNLSPGKHGIHIRANGECTRRGKHFNPTDSKHGPPSSARRHVGDFGNLVVGKDGTAEMSITTDSLTVADGHSSVVGKAIVITRRADDGTSQPDGNAGPAAACGVIEKR